MSDRNEICMARVAGPTVSVITTVLNERQSILRLLDSLQRQSRLPDEIVICDGGSHDSTVALIQAYVAAAGHRLPEVKLIIEPGANISRGRNAAIEAARGPVIAATDAGVHLAPEWLEDLLAPWDSAEQTDVIAVAGFFLPEVSGAFHTAMAATVLPLHDDIDPQRFLPSSRSVAFTKHAWREAGGYPEWLDYCEDLVFDFRINDQRPAKSTAFVWAPKAIAYFRPRESLGSFWRQYYRYARGDGRADLWRKRHAVRYATYLVITPVLVAIGARAEHWRWLGWLGVILGGIVYCLRPWQRLGKLWTDLSIVERISAWCWVPVIRIVGDCAKMAGYPVGLWWRWQNRNRPEIHWHRSKPVHGQNRKRTSTDDVAADVVEADSKNGRDEARAA